MNSRRIRQNDSVDVIIPVYNGERFIGDALSSVISQTHTPRRIIVVDDGSTDGTEEVVRSLLSEAPIVYVKQTNQGPSSARNAGIRASDANYVALLDADDAWEPTKLERQVSLFNDSSLTNLGVVHCNVAYIDGFGNPLRGNSSSTFNQSMRGQIFEKLLQSNSVVGSDSAVMIRRECFAEMGLFDEALFTCEDWDLWLRMAKRYDFDFIDEPLVKIRKHATSLSTNTDQMIVGRILVLSKLLRDSEHDERVLQELRYQILRLAVCRRLGMFRTDLTLYVDSKIVRRLFSNYPGMIRALFRGLATLSRKRSSNVAGFGRA
jgi:glycosyltransferase involved in cell wall biosynthesis